MHFVIFFSLSLSRVVSFHHEKFISGLNCHWPQALAFLSLLTKNQKMIARVLLIKVHRRQIISNQSVKHVFILFHLPKRDETLISVFHLNSIQSSTCIINKRSLRWNLKRVHWFTAPKYLNSLACSENVLRARYDIQ